MFGHRMAEYKTVFKTKVPRNYVPSGNLGYTVLKNGLDGMPILLWFFWWNPHSSLVEYLSPRDNC